MPAGFSAGWGHGSPRPQWLVADASRNPLPRADLKYSGAGADRKDMRILVAALLLMSSLPCALPGSGRAHQSRSIARSNGAVSKSRPGGVHARNTRPTVGMIRHRNAAGGIERKPAVRKGAPGKSPTPSHGEVSRRTPQLRGGSYRSVETRRR
jgi:hypothetical protein